MDLSSFVILNLRITPQKSNRKALTVESSRDCTMDMQFEGWARRARVLSKQIAPPLAEYRPSNSGFIVQETSTRGSSTEVSSTNPISFEPGKHFVDQVVIITGAGSGIGAAAAILFANHGARVVVCDLDEKAAQGTADFIRNTVAAKPCIVVTGDVTEDSYAEKVVEETMRTFGAIHVLVLNAGFTWDGMIHKMKDDQWDAMMEVHITAPFRMIRAAAPHMRDAAKREQERFGWAKPRSIVTISSVSGIHGNAGQSNYAAAKAGVVGLTKALAKEWGHLNIRSNALVFGHFRTRLTQDKSKGASISFKGKEVRLGIPQGNDVSQIMQQMIALGRVGTPEEAAGAILMIAGPYASYITGQAIEVTGGGWM